MRLPVPFRCCIYDVSPSGYYDWLGDSIIGSGPTGFYAAEALLKCTDAVVYVDMFDLLPTPSGNSLFIEREQHQLVADDKPPAHASNGIS